MGERMDTRRGLCGTRRRMVKGREKTLLFRFGHVLCGDGARAGRAPARAPGRTAPPLGPLMRIVASHSPRTPDDRRGPRRSRSLSRRSRPATQVTNEYIRPTHASGRLPHQNTRARHNSTHKAIARSTHVHSCPTHTHTHGTQAPRFLPHHVAPGVTTAQIRSGAPWHARRGSSSSHDRTTLDTLFVAVESRGRRGAGLQQQQPPTAPPGLAARFHPRARTVPTPRRVPTACVPAPRLPRSRHPSRATSSEYREQGAPSQAHPPPTTACPPPLVVPLPPPPPRRLPHR